MYLIYYIKFSNRCIKQQDDMSSIYFKIHLLLSIQYLLFITAAVLFYMLIRYP